MIGLLERSEELRAIDAAVRSSVGGAGAVVVVGGVPGIGKTALLRAALHRADRAGMRVLRAAGTELERDFAFGVARSLLAPVVDGDAPDALRAEAGPPAGEGDQAGAVAGVHRFVVGLVARGPLALVVDDVQWADRASIRCLAYIARRLDDRPLLLVVGGRDGSELRALHGDDATIRTLRPRPLSAPATAELVRAVAPGADAALCNACHTATGGMPLYVRELARGLHEQGLEAGPDATRRLARWSPEHLTRIVDDRLASLPPQARALAAALTTLDAGASLHEVGLLAALDADARAVAGDALRRVGILAPGRRLEFAHPVLRAATADTLLPGAADRLHREAARLLAGQDASVQRIAAQVMACEPAGDAWACDRLLAAAEEAQRRRAPESAVRYLRRALAEPPAVTQRVGVLVALGTAEAQAFDQDAAIEHVQEALTLARDPIERLDAALHLAAAVFSRSGDTTSAIEGLLAGLRELDDTGLAAKLEACIVPQGLSTIAARRATAPLGARVLQRVEAGGDATASCIDLSVAAIELTIAARRSERVVELARASLDPGERHPALRATTLLASARCLAAADALDAAEAVLEAEVAGPAGAPVAFVHQHLAHFLADIGIRRGDLREAERVGLDVWTAACEHDWPMMRQAATGLLAELCVELGDLERGQRLLAEARCLEPAHDLDDAYTTTMLLAGRGRLRLADGLVDEGLADLLECGRRLDDFGEVNPALVGWRAPAALALGGDAGRELAAENLALAERFGAPRAVGIALRTGALLSDDAAARERGLRQAVAVLERSPARLEHARALADLALTVLAGRRHEESRPLLLEAYELAHRCGATALARRVADGLRAVGARPRTPFLRGPESLTTRERTVSRLAAEGRTNREIAEELVVTVRTVEFHLSRAFRKLGIASRTELGVALARASAAVSS